MKSTQDQDIFAGLAELIQTELSVDMQWLARITASPETVFELLLETTRYERCPMKRQRYREIHLEEQLQSYLQLYKYISDSKQPALSGGMSANKLFLVP